MEQGLPLVFCLFIFMGGCVSSRTYNFNNSHVALFVFGDSLFDPGNNIYINPSKIYATKFWRYGESYFNHPTGRYSDGRIILDFIGKNNISILSPYIIMYAGLPLIPAYLNPSFGINDFVYGANFASAGAGALVETSAGSVISLETQLKYFSDLETHFRKNLGDAKTNQLLFDAVFLFSCGSNDYFSFNFTILPHMYEQHNKKVMGNLSDAFKGIIQKGGRKIAIANLPESGNTRNEEIKILFSVHNQQLSEKLEELEKQLEGFMYAIFDYNTALNNRMKNPSQYGDIACCGSGPFRGIFSCGREKEFELCDNVNDYLFFDPTHPNEVAYQQLAELFWNGNSSVTTPYNLKTFFQGRNPSLLSGI